MTISSTTSKDQHNGNGSATSFNYTFKIQDQAHLEVTKTNTAGADTVLTITTDYTVTGVDNDSGGSITYPVLGAALASGEKLTIRRMMDFLQTTDLQNQGGFFAEVHEDVFDRQTIYALQSQEELDRSIKAPVTDSAVDMTLPIKADRLGTVLAFNVTTGAPEAGPTIANANTVAGISADISTVAGISSVVTAVAADATDIGLVAGKAAQIGLLGTTDAISDMNVLGTADIVLDMNVLGTAANVTAMDTCATNIAAINAAPTQAGIATTQAGISTAQAVISTAQAVISTTKAGAASTSATASASSAASAATAKTAAEAAQAAAELAADNFDDIYLGAKASDPTLDNDGDALTAGDMYFNTGTDRMRIYSGSAWADVALDASTVVSKTSVTGSASLPLGTTAQRDGSPTAGYLRWNTTDTSAEVYDGSAWAAVGGGNSTTEGLYEMANTIGTVATPVTYVIGTGNNALSAGPITVESGSSVTIPSGSTWVIA
ncbi:MAG: hypothetical protein ABGY43_04230 [bacterium]|jgi:hypothetical protein